MKLIFLASLFSSCSPSYCVTQALRHSTAMLIISSCDLVSGSSHHLLSLAIRLTSCDSSCSWRGIMSLNWEDGIVLPSILSATDRPVCLHQDTGSDLRHIVIASEATALWRYRSFIIIIIIIINLQQIYHQRLVDDGYCEALWSCRLALQTVCYVCDADIMISDVVFSYERLLQLLHCVRFFLTSSSLSGFDCRPTTTACGRQILRGIWKNRRYSIVFEVSPVELLVSSSPVPSFIGK